MMALTVVTAHDSVLALASSQPTYAATISSYSEPPTSGSRRTAAAALA
jgi:hypothetical protein